MKRKKIWEFVNGKFVRYQPPRNPPSVLLNIDYPFIQPRMGGAGILLPSPRTGRASIPIKNPSSLPAVFWTKYNRLVLLILRIFSFGDGLKDNIVDQLIRVLLKILWRSVPERGHGIDPSFDYFCIFCFGNEDC